MSRYDFTGITEWNKIQGYFDLNEAIAIQNIVKQLPAGANVVELGSFRGRSSVAIASVLPPESTLYCVDCFQYTVLKPGETKPPLGEIIQQNTAAFAKTVMQFKVNRKIRMLVMKTDEAAQKFSPEFFDLIFIDADHHYEPFKADLKNWYPKLKPGGYLFCDDYDIPKFPGIKQALDETGLYGITVVPSLWMHQKPGA